MNVKRVTPGCAIVLALIFVPPAQARDWTDIVTTPFVDPLLSRPPALDSNRTLPGDTHTYGCENSRYDPTKPLTLSEAINLALCHNPQVESAWTSIKVQAAQVGEARAAYLPTINGGISLQSQKSEYPESQFQVNTERTSNAWYATLTWRLLDFGGRGANRRSADALLEAALASHDSALQKNMATVIGFYFEAQTAHANREAREKNASVARQIVVTAQKREVRGAGAQSDTLQATTALAKAELEHARACGTYEKSLVSLEVSMGLPLQTFQEQGLTLAQDYQDEVSHITQDLATWLKCAQERHPAVVAAQAQRVSAQEKLTATRSEGLPTLDYTQSEYINGRPNQGLSATDTRESVVGLTLNIPLFDGFARAYKVRGAQAQIEAREAELRDIRNQVLGEVAKAYADTLSALRNLESSRHLLNAAQDALDAIRRKYDQGISDILEMLKPFYNLVSTTKPTDSK